jgi:hypothetical protein
VSRPACCVGILTGWMKSGSEHKQNWRFAPVLATAA